jgi:hypothetical protein
MLKADQFAHAPLTRRRDRNEPHRERWLAIVRGLPLGFARPPFAYLILRPSNSQQVSGEMEVRGG